MGTKGAIKFILLQVDKITSTLITQLFSKEKLKPRIAPKFYFDIHLMIWSKIFR